MQKSSGKRIPLWLPYTSKIEIKGKTVTFEYKGGVCSADISETLFIMFYGSVCDLSETFLELCARNGVPVCIHRRTMPTAVWITPSVRTTAVHDILSKQILFRGNEKKRVHIAKKLLQAKFKSMEWLVAYPAQILTAYIAR